MIGAIRVDINKTYFVDLFKMQQISKSDMYKQRPVIRKRRTKEAKQLNGKIRDERFFISEEKNSIKPNILELSKQTVLAKPDFFMIPPIIKNWHLRSFEIYSDLPYLKKIVCITILANIGIENLGFLLNKEKDAEKIINMLGKDLDKINHEEKLLERVISVYTMETFLYKIVNKSLRENDLSYIDHIGPFCYLIYEFIRFKQMNMLFENSLKPKEEFESAKNKSYSLWRTVDLQPEIIDLYDKNKVPLFIWYSFTSTTRKKEVAENFCVKAKMNTIFEIVVENTIFTQSIDIKEFSNFKNEDENILQAASILEMLEHKLIKGVHYIALKLIP